ncbi:MAG: PP2C family protein-serine/threonine phosphatase [Pirellulales bacterium]
MGNGTSLVYHDLTDIGRRRANNQDSRAVLPPADPQQYQSRGWFFLVADGMGAHAAGELASSIAARQVPLVYEKNAERSPPLALRRAVEQVNAEIHQRGENASEFRGMGTTCSVLVLLPRGALVAQVGDSRAYRVRKHTIDQLSRDHSLVWDLEASGGLSREQAGAAPRNIITRSMGPHSRVDVDLEGPFGVEAGDAYVLCSDGLSGQVADEEIGLVAATLPPRAATETLLGLALIRGGPDNVTVIVARAGAEEASPRHRRADEWPLTEEEPPARRPTRPAWWPLAASAVGLFVALLSSPWSDLTQRVPEPLRMLCTVVSAAALLVALGTLVVAIIGFLPADPGRAFVLQPGGRLGRGPYRSYDCKPRPALVEGIVSSIESAADGLADPQRLRTLELVARARQQAAGGSVAEALEAVAAAVAIYSRSLEAARSGDTTRGPAGREPPHHPQGSA